MYEIGYSVLKMVRNKWTISLNYTKSGRRLEATIYMMRCELFNAIHECHFPQFISGSLNSILEDIEVCSYQIDNQ